MATPDMSIIDWLTFLPYVLVALMLFGWSLIQILQTPRHRYDLLTTSIVTVGIGTAFLIASIGFDRGADSVRDWPPSYYAVIHLFLGLSAAIGLPTTWRNVWRAWRYRQGMEHWPPHPMVLTNIASVPSGAQIVRHLTESMPVVVADGNGIIQHTTGAFNDMSGYAPGELEGKDLTALMPYRYRGAHLAGMHRYLTTGESRIIGSVVSVELLCRNREERPVYLAITTAEVGGKPWFVGSVWPRPEGNGE